MAKRIEIWNARGSAKRSLFIQDKHRWHLDGQKLQTLDERYDQIEAERKAKEADGII